MNNHLVTGNVAPGMERQSRNEATEPTGDDGMLVLEDHLDDLCPDWRERQVWACGPGPMLDATSEHWDAAGLEDRLHLERFSVNFTGEGGEGGAAGDGGREAHRPTVRPTGPTRPRIHRRDDARGQLR